MTAVMMMVFANAVAVCKKKDYYVMEIVSAGAVMGSKLQLRRKCKL